MTWEQLEEVNGRKPQLSKKLKLTQQKHQGGRSHEQIGYTTKGTRISKQGSVYTNSEGQGFLENTRRTKSRTSNDSKGITICKGNTRNGYLGVLVEGDCYLACVEEGIIIMLKFIKIGY